MTDYKNVKITYIGGGSRGWARTLMNDLAKEGEIGGEVSLYDIDKHAAKDNAVIGNMLSDREDVVGKWQYKAIDDLGEALEGTDFVVISILPGTFDQMESDVHTPEKYGIYQSVGDSTGPGGIVRALRTLPMFVEFAKAIERYAPNAWVINFTNPMSLCVDILYRTFPKIKAFGCCHEVFATQKLLAALLKIETGIVANYQEIDVNVLGVNHFTWVDRAHYKNIDLMPILDKFVKEHPEGIDINDTKNWVQTHGLTNELVKFDLYKRYGVLAAAGDRHLAEFCPGHWYLESPEKVSEYGFALTSVKWRKESLADRYEKTKELLNGKEFVLFDSGEESVRQIKALLGLGNFVTNVNVPNLGQQEGLPIGAIVETNAYFSGDSITPLFAGKLPDGPLSMVQRIVACQELTARAVVEEDYELAFQAFINDPNMCLSKEKARELFDEMLYNTKNYLPAYERYIGNKN